MVRAAVSFVAGSDTVTASRVVRLRTLPSGSRPISMNSPARRWPSPPPFAAS